MNPDCSHAVTFACATGEPADGLAVFEAAAESLGEQLSEDGAV